MKRRKGVGPCMRCGRVEELEYDGNCSECARIITAVMTAEEPTHPITCDLGDDAGCVLERRAE